MAGRQFSTSFLIFLIFTSLGTPLAGREVPLPEEEAPTALFAAELQDTDVDFYIQGSWSARLAGGLGFTWGSAVEGVQPAVLPEFTEGYFFQQTPALDLSLWYRDRYFFETSLTEEQTLETFLFGYYGKEGETLQELRFGNTDIGYGEIGPFEIPAASHSSLGIYSRLSTESTEHHLALRYDPARSEELHFRGKKLLEEMVIPVDAYIRGRYFILPDSGISGLEVYLQDDEGSYSDLQGRRYRRLTSGEMVSSALEGLVYLEEAAEGDLVVHYTKNGYSVGNPSAEASMGTDALCGVSGTGESARLDLSANALDFDFSVTDYLGLDLSAMERSINGKTSLLIHSPGQWSPFELLGAYKAGSIPVEGTDLYLSPRGSGGGMKLPLISFRDAAVFRITPENLTVRAPAARYPLLAYTDIFPDAGEVYGPWAAGSTVPRDRELRLEKLTPLSGYKLGPEALEGSIQVLRNGVPTGNYSFNPDTGEISFFLPPASGERIDITYRSTDARAVGGDLFAASVNSFRFDEAWSADLNMGLRWNADPNAYITEAGQADGSILGVGGIDYQSEKLTFRLEGGVNISSPNTTGRLRLFGMDDSAYPVSPGPENLYPGAPYTEQEYDSVSLYLAHTDRGILHYRNYYTYSFAGGYTLQRYNADLPGENIFPYNETGGENRTGPYPAATGSETDGDALVLEFELGSSQWVAGRIPLADGNGGVDLSSLRALSLLVKHTGRPGSDPSGTLDLHFVIGRLAEDLDADGIMDREDSPYDNGFIFNPSTGPSLPVSPALTWAPGDSRVNTEDLDGNGVLDGSRGASAALPEPVVKTGYRLGGADPTASAGSWYRILIPLNSGDRQNLVSATALDIILENTGPSSAEGRLLVADIDFQGSPFTGSPAEETTTLEIHTRALDPGGADYDSLMSQGEAELLNGNSVFDTKVLRIAWDISEPSGDSWSAEGFLNPADIGEYGALSFFMKTGTTAPDPMTLVLRNPDGEGLAVEFSPPTGSDTEPNWRRYTWHFDAEEELGRITSGDTELTAADVSSLTGLTRKRNARGVNRLIIGGTAGVSGQIEIDEIYLHDPVTLMGAGGKSEFAYNHPAPLLTIAGKHILQDLSFRQVVYGKQDAYGGGVSSVPAENIAFTNDLVFYLIDTRVNLEYGGRWGEGDYLPSGGYRLQIPLFDRHLLLEDRYHEEHLAEFLEAGRESSILLQAPEKASLRLTGMIDWNGEKLNRQWRLSGTSSPGQKLSLSMEGIFNTEKGDTDAAEGDMYHRYTRFSTLLLPEETRGALYRSTEQQLGFFYQGDLFFLGFSPGTSSTTHPGEEPFSLTTTGSWTLNMRTSPPKARRELGSLSLTYGRSAQLRGTFSEETGFFRDLEEIYRRFPDFPLLWTGIPLTEIWTGGLRNDFIEQSDQLSSASYSAESSLVYRNQPGSRLFNLFLPTRLSAGAARTLLRNYDSITDTLSLSGSYRSTAVNLFGKLGRHPRFPWYRSEEIGHSLGYSGIVPLTGETGKNEERHTISAGQLLELTISERSSLGMKNNWEVLLPEEEHGIDSTLYWERRRPVEWDIPFRERLKANRQFLQHREEVDFSWKEEPAAEETRFSLLFAHTSELRIPETGFFRVFGRLGYSRVLSSTEGDPLGRNTLALEIGAETELQF